MYANVIDKTGVFTNKFLKLVMCLVIAFTFLYAQPKEKYQSANANPLIFLGVAAWEWVVKPILVSIAIDIAVSMGIKFLDKTHAKRIAGELVEDAKKHLKDADFKKVYDKNSKKIKFTVGAGVIALLTTLWGKKVGDMQRSHSGSGGKFGYEDIDGIQVIKNDDFNTLEQTFTLTDPLYKTGLKIRYAPLNGLYTNNKAVDFATKSLNIIITPQAYKMCSKVDFYDKNTNQLKKSFYVKGDTSNYLLSQSSDTAYNFFLTNDDDFTLNTLGGASNLYDSSSCTGYIYPENILSASSNTPMYIRYSGSEVSPRLFELYLRELENNNRTLIYADGMVIADNQKYVQLSGDYESLDTNNLVTALSGIGVTVQDLDFDIDLPPDTDMTGWIEGNWEDITDIVPNIIENNIPDVPSDYNPVTRPQYVVTEKQQETFNNQIIINIGGGGDGGIVAPIDGGLITYVRNSYDYAVNAVQTGVDGLQKVTAGFVGITALAGSVFAFMPTEMTVFITGAFLITLGIWVVKR